MGADPVRSRAAGDVSLTGRLDGGTTIRRGDLVHVGLLNQSLHWFDAEQETRIG